MGKELKNDEVSAYIKEKIQANNSVPIYIKLAESIKSALNEGLLNEGDFLPTERKLCDYTDTSRVTIRKALELLEKDKIIVRQHGKGTFIADAAKEHLSFTKSFSQKIILSGRTPDTVWISKSLVDASEFLIEHFALQQNTKVFLLKRIRSVDSSPISIEESYVPTDLIDSLDDVKLSLFDYFKERGIIPAKMKSKVTAEVANEELVKVTGYDKSQPMLVIKNFVYAEDGAPIEYSINYCRGDMYEFVI